MFGKEIAVGRIFVGRNGQDARCPSAAVGNGRAARSPSGGEPSERIVGIYGRFADGFRREKYPVPVATHGRRRDGRGDGFGLNAGFGIEYDEGFGDGSIKRRVGDNAPYHRYLMTTAGIGKAGELRADDVERIGGRSNDGGCHDSPDDIGRVSLVRSVGTVRHAVENGADLFSEIVVEVGCDARGKRRRMERGRKDAGGCAVVGVGCYRGRRGLRPSRRRTWRGDRDEAAEEVVGRNGVGDDAVVGRFGDCRSPCSSRAQARRRSVASP